MYPLIELHTWPSVAWMTLLWGCGDSLHLEAAEHFQKGSFRNRYHLAGPNGVQRLSIPLQKGKHQQTPIRQVRIAYDEPWQRTHWRSIVTAYGSAPFFPFFEREIQVFYEKKYEFLFDFNVAVLEWTLRRLQLPRVLSYTTDYATAPSPLDFRNQLLPVRENAPAWFRPTPYAQVFTERFGFLSELSVLDLLLCHGKQGADILQRSWQGHVIDLTAGNT
jgi:hypothetical protein